MNIPKGDYVNAFKPAVTPGIPTQGIHDPSTPYEPSNEKAWGPKGKWTNKSIQDIDFENQYGRTLSCVGQDGALSRSKSALSDQTASLTCACIH